MNPSSLGAMAHRAAVAHRLVDRLVERLRAADHVDPDAVFHALRLADEQGVMREAARAIQKHLEGAR